jgi:hypothetical protein
MTTEGALSAEIVTVPVMSAQEPACTQVPTPRSSPTNRPL